MQTTSFSSKIFFVTFIEDETRNTVVYLMANKSEVVDKLALYIKWTETQTSRRVKALLSDNGGEYKSAKMSKFCANQWILPVFTPPYTPQLNGVAERMNRTLVECARCILEHANFSIKH